MNLTEAAYAAGWRVVRALPRQVTWPVFAAAADLAARRPGPGTRRLTTNLRRVVGPELPDAELDALVRKGLRSYARYWLEAFRLPALDRDEILRTFHLEGEAGVGPTAVPSPSGRGLGSGRASPRYRVKFSPMIWIGSVRPGRRSRARATGCQKRRR